MCKVWFWGSWVSNRMYNVTTCNHLASWIRCLLRVVELEVSVGGAWSRCVVTSFFPKSFAIVSFLVNLQNVQNLNRKHENVSFDLLFFARFSISTFLPNLFVNFIGTLFPCRKLGRELSLYVSEAKTKQMDEIMDKRHAAQIGRLGVQTNLRSNK